MKKILFVIAKYKDYRQQIFDEIISPRNKEYCDKHGFKYVVIGNETPLELYRGNPIWWKFQVIKNLIDKNIIKEDDVINCHDADMYITDIDADFTSNKSFTYSIDSGNTHCMGWYSLKINNWSKNLVNLILNNDRFNKLNWKETIHPKFNTYSSFWQSFAEQASWYSLAGIIRHSDIPFWDLPNYGYHSDYNEDTIYSIEELNENVKILPTEYNVTEWIDESSCQFNINKISNKEIVKLRHFAGGQDWNNIRNWV
jgi:hypothetical protein